MRMSGDWVVIPSSTFQLAWRVGQAENGNNGQMELIQRIENTGQGCLITQLALQSCDWEGRLPSSQADCHACHTIRPVWIDSSLHPDLVGGRPVERDGISERSIRHD
jgi:hypothetical protein